MILDLDIDLHIQRSAIAILYRSLGNDDDLTICPCVTLSPSVLWQKLWCNQRLCVHLSPLPYVLPAVLHYLHPAGLSCLKVTEVTAGEGSNTEW